MIEIVKSFLNKCDGNEELTRFSDGLIECWTHGDNAMYWQIEDDKNLVIIKDFFKEIYNGQENRYSIKKWEPSYGRKEYEIKWRSNLVDVLMSEVNK